MMSAIRQSVSNCIQLFQLVCININCGVPVSDVSMQLDKGPARNDWYVNATVFKDNRLHQELQNKILKLY